LDVKILSPAIAAKIAAGEVIERPASVVKELVENAIDANANSINVEIKNGGLESIRVSDNGSGINPSDIKTVFERFATSKISSYEDIETISTLGFRGEALPSIASVSEVTLLSRLKNAEVGHFIEINKSQLIKSGNIGLPEGTNIIVNNLFKDFPGRLKFLKSPRSETSRINNLMYRYAIGYPKVKFNLSIDGRISFNTNGNGKLQEAITSIYGINIAEGMINIFQQSYKIEDSITITGLVSNPAITRSNRTYITLFVNGRWVNNRIMGLAIEQAYRGFVPYGRFPIAVLNLQLPYEDVDVNVHPAKTEVRFHKEQQIFGLIHSIVSDSLSNLSPIPNPPDKTIFGSKNQFNQLWKSSSFTDQHVKPEFNQLIESGQALNQNLIEPEYSIRKTLPILRPLGQIKNTYIVAEGPESLYLIDQHAAHERITFEKVIDNLINNISSSQLLLEAKPFVVTSSQEEILISQSQLLESYGFHIEIFGNRRYLIRAVPSLIGHKDPIDTIINILDLIIDGGGFEDWREKFAYSIACHSAIRAGKVLNEDEIKGLLLELEKCAQPYTCPHGRPTTIQITSNQLERAFKRK